MTDIAQILIDILPAIIMLVVILFIIGWVMRVLGDFDFDECASTEIPASKPRPVKRRFVKCEYCGTEYPEQSEMSGCHFCGAPLDHTHIVEVVVT